jgi:DNA-directed RNA polymerase subunit L
MNPYITVRLAFTEGAKMELNLISKDKKSVVIEFTEVKETLVHPLVDRLLADKDVIFAAYKTGHPQLDKPKLTVKTQKFKPETAVKKAADSLSDEVKLLKKEFEKSMKKGTKAKKTTPKKAKSAKGKKVIPKKKSKVDKPKKTQAKEKTKTAKKTTKKSKKK